MKNKIRFTKTSKISVIVSILIVIIFNLIFYTKMPDMVPNHWNIDGEVDGYTTKFNGFILLPIILVLSGIFLNFMLDNDPKNKNQKNMAITIGKIAMPGILLLIMVLQTVFGLGMEFDVNLVVNFLLGILFIAIGNYLPKAKRNYTVGIKLPWTLNSDENWNKTHRLGGILFILAGMLFIANIFISSEIVVYIMILTFILPAIYSFYLYTKGI